MRFGQRRSRRASDELTARAQEVTDLLGRAFIDASTCYVDYVDIGGRKLSQDELQQVRHRLTDLTIVLREVGRSGDVISVLAEDGQRIGRNTDLLPTVCFLRVLQRGFALISSDDASRRRDAMSAAEFNLAFQPLAAFWAAL